MRIASLRPALPGLRALLDHVFGKFCAEHHADADLASHFHVTSVLEAERCYTRLQLKLRRDGAVNRLLRIAPCNLGTEDAFSALRPCMQLFRSAPGTPDEVELDPNGFCEVLLVLSYDVRPGTNPRMSERSLRGSEAAEMVLVRMLRPEAAANRNAAFVRCRIMGHALEEAARADYKHYALLPLSALAQPRAAFPAFKASNTVAELPVGTLTPWTGTHVNIFMLL
jgi:hypothetical protein